MRRKEFTLTERAYIGVSCGYACHARSVMYIFVHSFRERGNCCHNLHQSTPSQWVDLERIDLFKSI